MLDNLLEKDRAARLVAFAARQPAALTLGAVLETLVERTWGRVPSPGGAPADEGYPEPEMAAVAATGDASGHGGDPSVAVLTRVVQRALVDRLMQLVSTEGITPEVRAETLLALRHIRVLAEAVHGSAADAAHRQAVAHDIARFLDEPKDWTPKATAPPPPPGAPVGA